VVGEVSEGRTGTGAHGFFPGGRGLTARGVVSVGRVVSSTWLVRPAMAKRRPRPHDVTPKRRGDFLAFSFLVHFSMGIRFSLDITIYVRM